MDMQKAIIEKAQQLLQNVNFILDARTYLDGVIFCGDLVCYASIIDNHDIAFIVEVVSQYIIRRDCIKFLDVGPFSQGNNRVFYKDNYQKTINGILVISSSRSQQLIIEKIHMICDELPSIISNWKFNWNIIKSESELPPTISGHISASFFRDLSIERFQTNDSICLGRHERFIRECDMIWCCFNNFYRDINNNVRMYTFAISQEPGQPAKQFMVLCIPKTLFETFCADYNLEIKNTNV